MKPLALAAALAVLSVPGAAGAHGVEAEVARDGAAVAVRARYHGGRPLAGARYEIVSPARPDEAREAGQTDRHGWLAFQADAPGTWLIRIADASGHGRLVEVEVTPAELAAARAAAAPPPPAPEPAREPAVLDERAAVTPATPAPDEPATGATPSPDERATAATPLRVAAGALAILGLFGAAFALQRRRQRGAR